MNKWNFGHFMALSWPFQKNLSSASILLKNILNLQGSPSKICKGYYIADLITWLSFSKEDPAITTAPLSSLLSLPKLHLCSLKSSTAPLPCLSIIWVDRIHPFLSTNPKLHWYLGQQNKNSSLITSRKQNIPPPQKQAWRKAINSSTLILFLSQETNELVISWALSGDDLTASIPWSFHLITISSLKSSLLRVTTVICK